MRELEDVAEDLKRTAKGEEPAKPNRKERRRRAREERKLVKAGRRVRHEGRRPRG